MCLHDSASSWIISVSPASQSYFFEATLFDHLFLLGSGWAPFLPSLLLCFSFSFTWLVRHLRKQGRRRRRRLHSYLYLLTARHDPEPLHAALGAPWQSTASPPAGGGAMSAFQKAGSVLHSDCDVRTPTHLLVPTAAQCRRLQLRLGDIGRVGQADGHLLQAGVQMQRQRKTHTGLDPKMQQPISDRILLGAEDVG